MFQARITNCEVTPLTQISILMLKNSMICKVEGAQLCKAVT